MFLLKRNTKFVVLGGPIIIRGIRRGLREGGHPMSIPLGHFPLRTAARSVEKGIFPSTEAIGASYTLQK